MNFINLLKIAIRAIANNAFRSFLSMLGIIIGVGAVIIMMAIGQGSKNSIKDQISSMGSNMIMIRPGGDIFGGVRMDPSAMQTLKVEDYEAIVKNKYYVNYVSPEVTTSGQVIYGANNASTTMYGESAEYLDINSRVVEEGDMFSDEDIKKSAKVCVVGQTIVDNLFPNGGDPIGKTIRFKNIPFRIIGVLKAKGYNGMGMDQDDLILAPYSTVMKRIQAQTYFGSINCSALSEEYTEQAIEELTQVLRETHKIKDGQDENFSIHSQQEIMETMDSTMNMVTLILVVAAGFSLLVAGIGIMNIMLVSVTERTKEIGLRMSVGASGLDICNQFLLESIMISVTGGAMGVGFGWLVSLAANTLLNFPAEVPLWSVIVSFIVCVIIGVGFGYFPARKAARMDPIEAIRYE
ncbi:MAG: ABC transporter permease [Bacteroidales bacterium]|nr:ABC transporter permease [Bacteroidales bacterium]